jgi:hypothetical protein
LGKPCLTDKTIEKRIGAKKSGAGKANKYYFISRPKALLVKIINPTKTHL